MIFKNTTPPKLTSLEKAISDAHRMDETLCIRHLIDTISLSDQDHDSIQQHGEKLVKGARSGKKKQSGLDAFMAEYDLSSDEGIALMCLAEALLRIPDKHTADKLIQDKICKADWRSHLKQSDSVFVNAATWGLMLTGKIIDPGRYSDKALSGVFKKLISRSSEGSIRTAIRQAMKILGKQFVLGETITEAQKRAKAQEEKGYTYSYDMLGEAAMTDADAQYYQKSYMQAIESIGTNNQDKDLTNSAGISVKLSALHPRYESAKRQRVMTELYVRIKALAERAKHYNIGFTIDAEEVDRLEISLAVIEQLAVDPDLAGWNGLGLAVQAYQKRAFYVLDWLADLAKRSNRRFMVRLVKGAYWDSEIKLSQEFGQTGYPVFTRKVYTDVSYLACAQKLLANTDAFYPQFATHNAHTLAAVKHMAGSYHDFEFQCLHGMGDALYDQVVTAKKGAQPCRIYAPVGSHKHLLAYLVRRLLENGANSSFVNRLIDAKVAPSELVANPIAKAKSLELVPHPSIPLPRDIYGEGRVNAAGMDLNNIAITEALDRAMQQAEKTLDVYPLIDQKGKPRREPVAITNPTNGDTIGTLIHVNEDEIEHALSTAYRSQESWDQTPVEERAACLERMATLLEKHMAKFMLIAIKEAGKSIPNAIAEVREAIDFCRYYAEQARNLFGKAEALPGPTGELNELSYHGRGVIVCISPWNFPLAIFLGEVTAALVSGNTVLAKPAEQTSAIAFEAVKLLHEAGIPKSVLQFLPGRGSVIGNILSRDARVCGVIFTGSTETAKTIQKNLAEKEGPIATFIAETGGQNAMIVDSSALLEQVTADVITSAFDSAGQRCSALRVLFVQEEIADELITMIKGAMEERVVGDPTFLSTDIGPVIDARAQKGLLEHIEKMKKAAKTIYQMPLDDALKGGTFVPPSAFEISDITVLEREVFGPILHIVRYKAKNLAEVIQSINSTGYGLTGCVHSRISSTVDFIRHHLKVGNLYVNRNQVGAVVGVQPFGGEGLSGTGPKAGGPHYLTRLSVERAISVNTTASGGNASLMTLEE